MLLYVSGPYSGANGNEIGENIAQARGIAIKLWETGHYILCPHLNTYHFERDCKADYCQYLKGDCAFIARCDGLVCTPDWKRSRGARIEVAVARLLGKPVWVWPDAPSCAAASVGDLASAEFYDDSLLPEGVETSELDLDALTEVLLEAVK